MLNLILDLPCQCIQKNRCSLFGVCVCKNWRAAPPKPRLQDHQPLSQPGPNRSSGIIAYTRSPHAYVHLPPIPDQPKKWAKELERKSVIVDMKKNKMKNKMKTNTNRPLFQLKEAGPSTTPSDTSLVQREGRSTSGSSHDQAPASGSPSAGNHQGDQNCNTQSSGLPSRSSIPSSLSEIDALVVSFSRAYHVLSIMSVHSKKSQHLNENRLCWKRILSGREQRSVITRVNSHACPCMACLVPR